jgi:hypothetical protein
LDPDQLPEAVQDVASVDVHVRMVLPPLGTMLGLAPILTVGAVEPGESELTVTVVDSVALPPGPVQVNMN